MSLAVEVPATILFSMFYFIFSLGFVYQSKEFVGLGLTPQYMLTIGDWVGSPQESFIHYHIRRTSGTLVLQSLLPFGYLLGYSYVTTQIDFNYKSIVLFWNNWPQLYNLLLFSTLLPVGLISLTWYWSHNDWAAHPVVKKIQVYAMDWKTLAEDINSEFRRIDKISVQTNPLQSLVITDNWIVLLGFWPWHFHISHQSDASLQVLSSDDHTISTEGELGGAQFLQLQVNCRKPNVANFSFRVNSLEYHNLQTKLTGQIENVRNIQIYKTVSERFVEVFKEQIVQNGTADSNDDLEPCIGCMAVTANVKLVRRCAPREEEEEEQERCVNCYCRPMWCIDCMGKWFASRQNQSQPETWLGSKCPCPTCRSKFCVLDVCLLQ